MPSQRTLPILGYRDQQVPNTFVRRDEATSELGILLPGLGYSCDMPLFYYAELLLHRRRADIVRAEYAYNRVAGFADLPTGERWSWITADVEAVVRTAIGQRAYDRVVVIAKSIATRALAQCLPLEPTHSQVSVVWLTPLLREDSVRDAIRSSASSSFVAIGAADPHYDAGYLDTLATSSSCAMVIVPEADHSLVVADDALASIQALERVISALGTFLDSRSSMR
jgi:hypothetical protein